MSITTKQPQNEEYISIRDLLSQCRQKWYWFIISAIVMLLLAFFYVKSTPNKYERTASVLIKGTEGTTPFDKAANKFDVFDKNANVFNEIISIESPAVIQEVVKRLDLTVEYRIDSLFNKRLLYNEARPFLVKFLSLNADKGASMKVEYMGSSKYKLSDMRLKDDVVGDPIVCMAGQEIKSPLGRLKIEEAPKIKDFPSGSRFTVRKKSAYGTLESVKNRLTVNLSDEDATVIDISIVDESIKRAEDIINMVILVYSENWVADKSRMAVSTSQFINNRLEVIEKDLGMVDEDISKYKSKNLIPDLQSISKLYVEQYGEGSSQSLALQNQISVANYVKNFVNRNIGNNQMLPTNLGINDDGIKSQIAEYNTLILKRQEILRNGGENNPVVAGYDQALSELRSAMTMSADNVVAALRTQLDNVKSNISKSASKIAQSPQQAKYLMSVEREQQVKESLYMYLLEKREENELSRTFNEFNTRIITPPMGSNVPVSPKKNKIYLLAFLVSLFLPLLMMFFKEYFDVRVRTKKDLEALDIPFVGDIPGCQQRKNFISRLSHRKKEEENVSLVVEKMSRNSINEAFRVLRTNVSFMLSAKAGKNKGKLVMVTSANPSSGKTFVSLNLSECMAINNKKVLAIDMDMRKATMSQSLGLGKRQEGLSHYLLGKSSLEDVVEKASGEYAFDVIPVGIIPPNPSELLMSDNFSRLMKEVRDLYDFVVIDCPPVEIVADAQIINGQTDLTVFVVRSGSFTKSQIPMVNSLSTSGRYENMVVLLNDTRYGKSSQGYSKYGYGYGYVKE